VSAPSLPTRARSLRPARLPDSRAAQASHPPKLWPGGWWRVETCDRAIEHLRGAGPGSASHGGLGNGATEATVYLVGLVCWDEEQDAALRAISPLAGAWAAILQGSLDLGPDEYWRGLAVDFRQVVLVRGALQLARLEDARAWSSATLARRKLVGQTRHQFLPLLGGLGAPGTALAGMVVGELVPGRFGPPARLSSNPTHFSAFPRPSPPPKTPITTLQPRSIAGFGSRRPTVRVRPPRPYDSPLPDMGSGVFY
jgi:hypothetical protein